MTTETQLLHEALEIADAIEDKTLLASDIRNMAARTIRRLAALSRPAQTDQSKHNLEMVSTAQPASGEEVPGLCCTTFEDDGVLTLRFLSDEDAQVFMDRYQPSVEGGIEAWSEAHPKDAAQPSGEVLYVSEGQLREVLNGNKMSIYASPEPDRFADTKLYTAPQPATSLG